MPDPYKLLEIKEVIEEIKRHLWIESEKAGRDIGFDVAAEDWLNRFSETWMKHHRPQLLKKSSTSNSKNKKSRTRRTTVSKTRRAGSYIPK